MTSMIDESKMSQIACNIKFILILDNNGKLIYGKYYNCPELDTARAQREFEKKICQTTQNINVSKDEIDIFTINQYNVITKICNEIALFIGINEDENECIANNFFSIFENVLSNVLNDKFTKESVMNNFDKVIVVIDEMVNEGVVMNTDGESIEKILSMRSEGGQNFISFDSTSSSGQSSSLFGSLLSGARTIFGS